MNSIFIKVTPEVQSLTSVVSFCDTVLSYFKYLYIMVGVGLQCHELHVLSTRRGLIQ